MPQALPRFSELAVVVLARAHAGAPFATRVAQGKLSVDRRQRVENHQGSVPGHTEALWCCRSGNGLSTRGLALSQTPQPLRRENHGQDSGHAEREERPDGFRHRGLGSGTVHLDLGCANARSRAVVSPTVCVM